MKNNEEKGRLLLASLNVAFDELVDKRQTKLLENDDDNKYSLGYDSDSIDNGCGQMTVRRELIQDEDKAYDDARDEILTELCNNETDTILELFENNDFTKYLADFLS